MARRFDVVAYLKLVRFPLVFTAIADSAAGFMVGSPIGREYWSTLCLLALTSGCLYLFGMALNDIADLDKDRRVAPGKVLPSGRVSLTGAVVTATLLLGCSLAAAVFAAGPFLRQGLAIWACVLVCILAYDLHWIKVPPIMGLVRAFNFLLGLSAARPLFVGDEKVSWIGAVLALPLFGYVTSLTYVSTLEDGPVDRRRVAIGAVSMSVCVLLSATVISLVMAVFGRMGGSRNILYGLIAAWVLVAWIARRAWKARERKDVMLLVRDGVAGIILVDAALLFSDRSPLQGLVVAGLLLPAALSLAVFKKLA